MNGFPFTRVAYLQGNGEQWIDTGIKPSEFDEFEIKFMNTKGVDTCGNFFGVDNNQRADYISNAITYYSTIRDWFAYGNNEVTVNTRVSNTPIIYRTDSSTAYISYKSTKNTCAKSGEVIDVSMHLFRANGAAKDTVYKDTGLQIFYASFKKNGQTLAHFIPCIDADKTPCMVDIISNRAFYNQGSGEFAYHE